MPFDHGSGELHHAVAEFVRRFDLDDVWQGEDVARQLIEIGGGETHSGAVPGRLDSGVLGVEASPGDVGREIHDEGRLDRWRRERHCGAHLRGGVGGVVVLEAVARISTSLMRSTRKLRHAARSRSLATRYQRCAVCTICDGSTLLWVTSPANAR